MFKILKSNLCRIVILALALFSFESKASHIVGGQIEYKWVSGNVYEITVNFYRDCAGVNLPNSVRICIFDQVTNNNAMDRTIQQDTVIDLVLGDQCYTPPGLCVQSGVYADTVTLANNPNGYYIMFTTGARNTALYNATPSNMTWYTEMPDPALHNSGPIFNNYPRAYFCHSYPNFEDLSATDPDGDSLRYYMEIPLLGTSVCQPKPTGGYTTINYRNSCTSALPFGPGTPAPTMDVSTGVMQVTPAASTNGRLYVLAMRIEEWRNGVKIGETRRDVQYTVLTCVPNVPPYFSYEPNFNNYAIAAGEEVCFDVDVTDINDGSGGLPANGVYFTYVSEILNSSDGPSITITPNPADSVTAPDTASINVCIKTKCSDIRPQPYRITIQGNDTSCYGINTIEYDLDLLVVLPGIVDLYPNVFTPNADGKNDVFRTNALPSYCFDEFEIEIYNRWGNKVFESSDFNFAWDGTSEGGKNMDDGVYYYTLRSKFQETENEEHGFVHLIRDEKK